MTKSSPRACTPATGVSAGPTSRIELGLVKEAGRLSWPGVMGHTADLMSQPLVQLRIAKEGRRAGDLTAFLPTTRAEMEARGWRELDILIVTGDAYVDHPAFGPVLVARFLEGRGYKVGLVAQPDWQKPDDIARMGRPKLFVGVTAGNLDSMLNKLTAQKKMRGEDQYS